MAITRLSAPLAAILTLEEVKRHLRIEHDDDNAYLTDLIAQSTAHLESVSGLRLLTQTWRQYLDAMPQSRSIRLAVQPVQSIAAMQAYDEAGNPQAVSPASLELDAVSSPPRLVVHEAVQTAKAVNGIEIDIVAGYGDTPADVPDSLRRALLLLVAHAYEFRGAVPVDQQPASEPQGFRTLIAPFRRVGL